MKKEQKQTWFGKVGYDSNGIRNGLQSGVAL